MLKEAEYDENNWLTKQTISRRWSLESASSDEEKTTLFGLKPKRDGIRRKSRGPLYYMSTHVQWDGLHLLEDPNEDLSYFYGF